MGLQSAAFLQLCTVISVSEQIFIYQGWVIPCLLILASLPSILSLTAGTERAESSCTRDESKKALSKGVD